MATGRIEIGPRAEAERLFCYPNDGHDDQTLEQTIAHYIDDSLRREGRSVTAAVADENGTIAVTLTGPDADVGEIERRYSAFLDIGRLGMRDADAFRATGKWSAAWKFLLPLGVPIAFATAVEIMDFPPLTLISNQDYLKSKTTGRWWELLVLNGVPDADKARYSCILDIVPVAAPASDGENLKQSGIYDGPFDSYGLPLLDLLSSSGVVGVQRPLIALGGPIRAWMNRLWQLSLNVGEIGQITLRDGRRCPVICSNHPSFFFYAVHSKNGLLDLMVINLPAGLAVMKQDIVVAAWHAEMGRNPTADPAAVLAACRQKWANRDDELLDLVKKQAGIAGLLEAQVDITHVLPHLPSDLELQALEANFQQAKDRGEIET